MNTQKTILIGAVIVCLACMVLLFSYGFVLGKRAFVIPERIYELPQDDKTLIQWRKDGRVTDIVSVTVIGYDATSLYVYVDYIYSGDHGDVALTCGGIELMGNGVSWGKCSPVEVKKGRGFVVLRLQQNNNADDFQYSDGIYVNLYDDSGSVFLEKEFPYKKLWLKNQPKLITYLGDVFGW